MQRVVGSQISRAVATVQPHVKDRTAVALPKQVTLDDGIVVGSPVGQEPLFRGTKSEKRFQAWHTTQLLGVARSKVPTERVSRRLLDLHQRGANALVSTSSREGIAFNFGDIVAKYDPSTVPTVVINETLKDYNTWQERAVREEEFTALFILSHALIETKDIEGEIVPNPFHLTFDVENSSDKKILEILQHVHNLYYDVLLQANPDARGVSDAKVGQLIAKYAAELISLYDEKCGRSENPYRKSLQELKAMSPEAARYVSFIEKGITSGLPTAEMSALKRISKDGADGIDPGKCLDLFKKDPYSRNADSTDFFKL